MLIALDIGNTNIKSVLYEEDQSRDLTIHSSLDEAIDYINRTNFNEAAICSVNPVINKILSERYFIKKYINISGRYSTEI